ncbi:ankyrin repeat and socs box protein [Anaeramoeba flamelloides]|uniref:Ankyrin repeat and socs box protein n=1 Tax=Anaeramoeba flamelloides TaxID=1746091 RepID=A0AAV7YQV7_9EUKA|nr:ankyrin repeat and socs box protein [Anaeramoeba flamelloides]
MKTLKSPLHELCRKGKAESLKFFLDTDPKRSLDLVNLYNEYGETPLHISCSFDLECTKILLKHSSDPNLVKRNGGHTALHIASYHNEDIIVKKLIKYGSDPEIRDQKGWTFLTWAIYRGSLDVVKSMCDREIELVKKLSTLTDNRGNNILHIVATASGDLIKTIACVELLFERQVCRSLVNKANAEGMFPLHLSAIYGNNLFLKILIKNGANYKKRDKSGYCAIHHATKSNRIETVSVLLMGGKSIDYLTKSGVTALMIAQNLGHDSIVKLLIQQNAKSLIHMAVEKQNLEVSKKILQVMQSQIMVKDKNGRTPLHIAAQTGNIEMMKFILGYGVSPNETDNDNYTALHLSIGAESIEAIKYLLKKNAKINISISHKIYVSALHLAIQKQNFDIIKLLVSAGADLDRKTQDKDNSAPIHYAVKTKNYDLIKFLLLQSKNKNAKSIDIDATDAAGKTALHHSLDGDVDECSILELLFSHRADPNIFDKSQKTVVHYAIMKSLTKCLQLIVKNGGLLLPFNKTSPAAHLTVLHNDNIGMLKILSNYQFDPNQVDRDGNSLCHFAAKLGKNMFLRYICHHGADINLKNNDGNTPLHCASKFSSNIQALRMLIKTFHSNIHIENNQGRTPLHIAAHYGNSSYCEFFIQNKANVNKCDNDGNTPLLLAGFKHWINTYQVLINGGALPLPHQAYRSSNYRLVLHYIEQGFPVEYLDNSQSSLLHLISLKQNLSLLAKVLPDVVDINVINGNGLNAIQLAAISGDTASCKILMAYGAKLINYPAEDLIPHELAKKHGHTECSKILKRNFIRRKVVHEIHQKVKKNVGLLASIYNQVITPLKSSKGRSIITPVDLDAIFSNINELIAVNKKFLKRINKKMKNWNSKSTIGDVFIQSNTSYSVYIEFSNNHERSQQFLKQYEKKVEWGQFIKVLSKDEIFEKLPLEEILTRVIFHVTEYVLLFKRLLKATDINHPDYSFMQKACDLYKRTAKILNIAKTKHENMIYNINLQKILNSGLQIDLTNYQDRVKILENDFYVTTKINFKFNNKNVANTKGSNDNGKKERNNFDENLKNNVDYFDNLKNQKRNKNKLQLTRFDSLGLDPNPNKTFINSVEKLKKLKSNLIHYHSSSQLNIDFIGEIEQFKGPLIKNSQKKNALFREMNYWEKMKVILFNDCILICKVEGQTKYKVIACFRLISTFVSKEFDTDLLKSGHYGFQLITEIGGLIFSSDNLNLVETWSKALKKTIKDSFLITDEMYSNLFVDEFQLNLIQKKKKNKKKNESKISYEKNISSPFQLFNKNLQNSEKKVKHQKGFKKQDNSSKKQCNQIQLRAKPYLSIAFIISILNGEPVVKEYKFIGFFNDDQSAQKHIRNWCSDSFNLNQKYLSSVRIIFIQLKESKNEYFLEI